MKNYQKMILLCLENNTQFRIKCGILTCFNCGNLTRQNINIKFKLK